MDAPVNDVTPVKIPRLSPSRAKEFLQCPKLYHYKAIEGRTTPPTIATTRGTLAHAVFERLFDLPHEQRKTPDAALAFLEPCWQIMVDPFVERSSIEPGSMAAFARDADDGWVGDLDPDSYDAQRKLTSAAAYRLLAPAGSPEEAEILTQAREYVTNYFNIERPWNFDPEDRELKLLVEVDEVPLIGYIDRLDRYIAGEDEERWVISDYKTGKLPSDRYMEENFFAMRLYALMLSEQVDIVPYSIRLIFVGAEPDKAKKQMLVTDELLSSTRAEIRDIWGRITKSATSGVWETKKQRLCDWCDFKAECPAWI
jgi:putative RecB family exonuclease